MSKVETSEIVRELADGAVANHGQLTAEELETLRQWKSEESQSMADAAKTSLGRQATDATIEDAMVVHSGYDHHRRA